MKKYSAAYDPMLSSSMRSETMFVLRFSNQFSRAPTAMTGIRLFSISRFPLWFQSSRMTMPSAPPFIQFSTDSSEHISGEVANWTFHARLTSVALRNPERKSRREERARSATMTTVFTFILLF